MWYLGIERVENWAWMEVFDKNQTQQIIDYGKDNFQKAYIGNNKVVDSKIRNSHTAWLRASEKEYRWVYEMCTDAVNYINREYFNYDLTAIEDLQLTKYEASDEPSYYGGHLDSHQDPPINASRKLSFSILLSDPSDFEGGDLKLHFSKNPDIADKVRGRGTFFPSNALHEVTPVTKGVRYSLVGWVTGPRFR
jgi:predicted 2-oxoglutarate/Fe(II)-dependent dioxygenase YbiX